MSQQVWETISPTITGFGLGLPIAKALVEKMDGEIKIESVLGMGSTMILQFLCAA